VKEGSEGSVVKEVKKKVEESEGRK